MRAVRRRDRIVFGAAPRLKIQKSGFLWSFCGVFGVSVCVSVPPTGFQCNLWPDSIRRGAIYRKRNITSKFTTWFGGFSLPTEKRVRKVRVFFHCIVGLVGAHILTCWTYFSPLPTLSYKHFYRGPKTTCFRSDGGINYFCIRFCAGR